MKAQSLTVKSSTLIVEYALGIRSRDTMSGQGIRVVSCKRQYLDLTIEELNLKGDLGMRTIFEANHRNYPNTEV